MALAVPTISVQDGSAAAAANVAANATAFVTPGNAVTFALQSSTGVQSARFVFTNTGTVLDGTSSPVLTGTGPFSWTVTMPVAPFTGILTTEVTDGQNVTTNNNSIVSGGAASGQVSGAVHRARSVSAANNESLTAFVGVTGGTPRDGVTLLQGQYVLLAGQTTKTQNGLYIVGVVNAGTAPLTRPPDYATGTTFQGPQEVIVSEGTLFNSTRWFTFSFGSGFVNVHTVDTTNVDFVPECVTVPVTLVAGTVTINNVPILSATKTGISSVRTTANTSTATTGGYHPIGGITPGISGTGSFAFQATVAAGTINNADISTLNVTILNR
jgi:hypothetical protein